MKKAIAVKQKVMGRPRTGIRPLMGFRADDQMRAAIVHWAENQPDAPTLSEAIRRLVEVGLDAGKARAKLDPRAAKKALKAIDHGSTEMAAIAKKSGK
jgi:hypothetical protein